MFAVVAQQADAREHADDDQGDTHRGSPIRLLPVHPGRFVRVDGRDRNKRGRRFIRVRPVELGDELSRIESDDLAQAAQVTAGINGTATTVEVVGLDLADQPGTDARLRTQVLDGQPTLFTSARESLADGHVTEPFRGSDNAAQDSLEPVPISRQSG